MKKNGKRGERGEKIRLVKFTRRAGIEPAYSDYEPNELPVTQPPQKVFKILMNRVQGIVQINTKKD